MPIKVSEIFSSYQGEGYYLGVKALFVRLAGCNYWSGKEKDREMAICQFCDTDFHEEYEVKEIETFISIVDDYLNDEVLIVFTGGEPLLQLKAEDWIKIDRYFSPKVKIAVETNGSIDCVFPDNIWVTTSPKANGTFQLKKYNEIKIVLPGGWNYEKLLKFVFEKEISERYLMPEDGGDPALYWKMVKWINQQNIWKLGIQAHKFWKIQ